MADREHVPHDEPLSDVNEPINLRKDPATFDVNSDTEILNVANINAKKNKSNLYLIKSYSFIDKTNSRRTILKKPLKKSAADLTEKSQQHRRNSLSSLITNINKQSSKKPKKFSFSKKLKQFKSTTNDSKDDLNELKHLLRKPSQNSEHKLSNTNAQQPQRPKSMPTSIGNRNDDNVTNATVGANMSPKSTAIKRESFLRQSLQSIRRSFSIHHKKHAAGSSAASTTTTCTSNSSAASAASSNSSSSSSASSTSSSTSDKGRIFEYSSSGGGIGDNNLGNGKTRTNRNGGSGVVIMLNGVKAPSGDDDNFKGNCTICNGEDVDDGGGCCCPDSTKDDNLAALTEEDDDEHYWNCKGQTIIRQSGNLERSTSSVSTLAATSIDTTSMAPLQSHTEAHSVTCLNTLDKGSNSIEHQQPQRQPQVDENNKQKYHRHLSIQSDNYSTANSNSTDASYQNLTTLRNSAPEERTLKHNSRLPNPQVSVASSTVSIRSISPSRKSASSNSSSNTTAKHEQSATAAAAAAATTPPEKEKKRKEVSSSRVKKFHRHFAQVSKDEKLINYFSCALVSDILLQGHLYITDQHFAFYSNVFGYITKVVIPTSSVTKISKEKTAKIIPNAVGVATADERHVFGSFISREAAFRLMCSVCPPLAPAEIIAKIPVDIEISEEYSIEDDSSCSISGNESPPQALKALAAANGIEEEQMLLRRNVAGSSFNITDGKSATNEQLRISDIPVNAKNNLNFAHHPNAGVRASAPPAARFNNTHKSSNPNSSMTVLPPNIITAASLLATPTTGAAASAATNLTMIIAGTASSTTTSTTSAASTPTPSTSSSPTTVMATPKTAAQAAADSFRMFSKNALLRLRFPAELHVVYLGVMLTMVLALFSVFLLYRILDIEAKTTSYRSPVEFNWRSGNDEDIFNEALRWQKELQTKSTEEAQNILTTNLEQIAKVRRSLETLSMLIHDRSSAYANRDDSD